MGYGILSSPSNDKLGLSDDNSITPYWAHTQSTRHFFGVGYYHYLVSNLVYYLYLSITESRESNELTTMIVDHVMTNELWAL